MQASIPFRSGELQAAPVAAPQQPCDCRSLGPWPSSGTASACGLYVSAAQRCVCQLPVEHNTKTTSPYALPCITCSVHTVDSAAIFLGYDKHSCNICTSADPKLCSSIGHSTSHTKPASLITMPHDFSQWCTAQILPLCANAHCC